jgi:hypothetical protein
MRIEKGGKGRSGDAVQARVVEVWERWWSWKREV